MIDTLPTGFAVRPPTMDDLQTAFELIKTCQLAEDGTPEETLENLRTFWQSPGFHLASDAWLVTTTGGRVAGYADIRHRQHVHFFAYACVHPEYCGRGIGTILARLTEARARQHIPEAQINARVSLTNWANSLNKRAGRLLEQDGYVPIRHSYRMEIEIAEAPHVPAWPEGIAVRTFVGGQDERAIYEADDEAFQDHWGYLPSTYEMWEHWELKREGFDPTLWFLAFAEDELAGICLCRYEMDLGWVETLAVRRPWRRKGLGMVLLLHSFAEFFRRGTYKVGLGVDAQNLTGALRLYERAGMHVARDYVAYEKELRPGVELSTQSLAV